MFNIPHQAFDAALLMAAGRITKAGGKVVIGVKLGKCFLFQALFAP